MQTSNLHAFITVAELCSFSRAAEQLCLTQSAISKRVAGLESELKCRLFDRIGHKVTLTEAGNTLLPKAYDLANRMADCQRVISNLSGSVEGKLSLGTSHHIGLHRLPLILKEYTREYPKVELDLHFMESESICNAVSQGSIELGIATLPNHPLANIITTEIWDDPLLFVCGREHPLTEISPLSIRQLSRHPAILPPHESATYKILDAIFKENNVELNTRMATKNLETIKMMTSINLGWSLLPKTMLSNNLTKLEVIKIKLKRRLGLVSNRDRTPSNAAIKLMELLTANAQRSGDSL